MVLVESLAHSYSSKNQKLATIREEVPNNSWHPKHSVMTAKAWWCCFGQSLLPKSIQVHASIYLYLTASPSLQGKMKPVKSKQHSHKAKNVDSVEAKPGSDNVKNLNSLPSLTIFITFIILKWQIIFLKAQIFHCVCQLIWGHKSFVHHNYKRMSKLLFKGDL